jgi:DNA-directed RNA polymerase subunit RPC12/RpoP
MIDFKCSQCGEEMEAPQDLAGQRLECPECLFLNLTPSPDAPGESVQVADPNASARPADAPRHGSGLTTADEHPMARRLAEERVALYPMARVCCAGCHESYPLVGSDGTLSITCPRCGHTPDEEACKARLKGYGNDKGELAKAADPSTSVPPADPQAMPEDPTSVVGSSVGQPLRARYVRPGDWIEIKCNECGEDIFAEQPLTGLTKRCIYCGSMNHVPGQAGDGPPTGWYAWWGGASEDHPLSHQAAEEWVALDPTVTHECIACGRDVLLANLPIPTIACPFCGFIPDVETCRAYLNIIDGSRQRQIARQPRLRAEMRVAARKAAAKNGPKRQGDCSRCGKANRSLRETEDRHWVCPKCHRELVPALATECQIYNLRRVGFTVPDDLTEKEGKRLWLLHLGRKLGLSLPDDTPLAELLRLDAENSFIERLQPIFAAEHERHVTEEIERRSEYLPPVRHFYTKVAGVTYKNDDGSDRQEILATCSPLETLHVEHDDNNPHDPNTIRVCTEDGRQIGHLFRDVASDVWWRMQHHFTYAAISANITGGTEDHPQLGMNIVLLVARPGVSQEEVQAYLDTIMPAVEADAYEDDS